MPELLDRITGPQDLKGLSLAQQEQLASEIRAKLIRTVTHNGGHLASNLGVVELTIALHTVFDSPRDRILWDVGHQSYVHKLLTGRREQFESLRQAGGLSGFPERGESPHDPFGTGHASTSISAALGLALARDFSGQNHHVIAVIGDGSLTGGMAYEALNHAGHLGTRLLVILNDNAMSISPNVGAIARSLNRLRLDPRYRRAKGRAWSLLARLPLGLKLLGGARRLKEAVRRLFLPRTMWEQMSFTYIGPVDGHNLAELERVLRRTKENHQGPTFLHVVTRKGKGYELAEGDPVMYHGLSPAAPSRNQAPTYTQVFAQTVLRLFQENPKFVAITAAMLEGTGLSLVAKRYPRRVFDVGLCEEHAVTLAAGLATQGYVPIVAIYSTFLQRAFDQIVHDVCLQNLPVVFALDRAGIVGEDGKTHQGLLDLSYLGCIPNLVVAAPADEAELQHLLYTAAHAGRPFALRYPRGQGRGVPLEPELRQLPVGRGTVLRQGQDLAIVALGSTVYPALEAAEILAQRGIEGQVINARYVKPLDTALVDQAACLSRVVTVEENVLSGGFGSMVALQVGSRARVERIALPDAFLEHGPQEELRAKYGLDAQGVAHRILAAFPELSTPSLASRDRP